MTSIRPKISIVFTSYNHANFLRQALDSLLAQTYKDFELIIIDDCSTDNSQEILKEYSQKDERIRLFLSDKNSGSYVFSTNRGASYARGEYLIFAQCDDYAEPRQLEELCKVLDSNPNIAVAFSASKMIDENDNFLDYDYNYRSDLFKKVCCNDTILSSKQMQFFLSESCVIPNLSAALLRRQKFIDLGGFSTKYKVLADWDFWFRLFKDDNAFYLRQPLNNFRQHNTTIRKTIKLKTQLNELFFMFRTTALIGVTSKEDKIRIEDNISKIWIGYIVTNIKPGLLSLFPLLIKSRELDSKFPIVFSQTCIRTFKNKFIKPLKSK